jgi:hypothetical protein
MSLFNLADGLRRQELDKLAAWTACKPLQQLNPAVYRLDAYGNIIRWADYGTQSDYGWEIDHVLPSALGGPDHAVNYRALHWRTNRSLGGQLGNALRL